MSGVCRDEGNAAVCDFDAYSLADAEAASVKPVASEADERDGWWQWPVAHSSSTCQGTCSNWQPPIESFAAQIGKTPSRAPAPETHPNSVLCFLRGNTSVGDFELGQVLIRALLLVPFAWLAKFAAARHATLFRLREHYAYKYSIAASVEGFKKQAPSLQDEIAAAAFRELTFNPADRMDSKSQESAHPNPVVDWIMRKLGATHDGERG